MALHLRDIPWPHAQGRITPIALKGAIVVGFGPDLHHYVGRHDGAAITTVAGPMHAFAALQLALAEAVDTPAPPYGGLTATAVIVDECTDGQDRGDAGC